MIKNAQHAAVVHAVFEYAGIALGAWLYRRERLRAGLGQLTAIGTFAIVAGLLLGAAIGNKAVFFIDRPDIWRAFLGGQPGWPGQSVVGGLLGGLAGVELAKAFTHQRQSTGDLMVWPIALGVALGRVGCFLAGLHDDTYGIPTRFAWGMDFGDGVSRYPTQLYEIAFVLALAFALHRGRDVFAVVPGLRFKLFLSAYLLWRLLIDGLKPVLFEYPGGLSGIQWVCAAALIVYMPIVVRACRRVRFGGAATGAA